jgi:hypothetical protein
LALVVVAAVWLLSLTSTIVGPLIAGTVIGAAGGVVVDALERRGWPRVAGAGVGAELGITAAADQPSGRGGITALSRAAS